MIRITCDYSLWNIIEDSRKYRLILYTDKKYQQPLIKMLTFVDVMIDGCISETPCSDEKSVYDLLFENKNEVIVLVYKDDFLSARKMLEGMGFQLGVNFKNVDRYSCETWAMPIVYDPMLGYNIGNHDTGAEGFGSYGDLNGQGVRILTLGGSTTDAFLFPFRSWGEFLHDTLTQRGISNVVCEGG